MLGYKLFSLLPLLAVTLAAPSNSWSSSSSSSASGSSGSGYDSSSSGSDSGYGSSGSSYDSGSSGSSYDSGSSGSGSSYGSSGGSYGGSSSGDGYGGGGGGKIVSATTIVHATTLTAASSYQTPSYGSGSGYSGDDLQSCLNTCQATFGSGSSSSSSSSGSSSSSSNSTGTGTSTSSSASATHTIIVAPTQGVLRFVPFAVDANEGDAIEFVWGAGPHTATLSDGENVCNRSTTSQAFDSGKLNATATFAASVLSSAPQFHYCTVATHCVQGMFGLINPPTNSSGSLASTAANASVSAVATKTTSAQSAGSTAGSGVACTSVDCWVSNWSLSGSGPQATASAVKAACSSTPGSWEWGGNWDFTSLLSDSVTQKTVVENVLYSRLMISMNPSMLVAGSSMSNFTAAPSLDKFVAAANTSASSATLSGVETVSASANGASSVSAAAADATSTGSTSGAARLTVTSGGATLSLLALGLGLAQLP